MHARNPAAREATIGDEVFLGGNGGILSERQ